MIGPRRIDKPLVLYGYGRLGKLAEEIFKELGIPIAAKIDRTTWCGKLTKDSLVAVCVATKPYTGIVKTLEELGFTDIVPVWDIIEAYPEVGIHNGWFFVPATNYQDDAETYDIMGKWNDAQSQKHYGAFMDWRISHYEHPDAAIEVSPSSLPSTLVNIRARQHPYRILSGNCEFIEIHNEGNELKTIEWSISELQRYRPRLSVACYHSRDGLWRIEKYLMDNLPDYRWTFRLTAWMGQGAYTYGTPMEAL